MKCWLCDEEIEHAQPHLSAVHNIGGSGRVVARPREQTSTRGLHEPRGPANPDAQSVYDHCGEEVGTIVVYTNKRDGEILRRRVCKGCGARFDTLEVFVK